MAGADNFPSAEGRITWAEHVAPKNHVKWGIRLTQGMPTSCGRADPIPADYTACRGHLSEADTHHHTFSVLTPARTMVTRLQLSLWGQVSSDHPPPSAQLNQPTYEREAAYFVLSKEKSTIMRTPPISSARLLCYLAITLIVFTLAVSIPANAAPGAGFTTFDTSLLGCLDSPNGIDCNNYAAKEDVFMNGGPNAAGLSDGGYFFAVLVPGFQNGGFLDGANGNLSDITASNGGPGAGDDVSNRPFTVAN